MTDEASAPETVPAIEPFTLSKQMPDGTVVHVAVLPPNDEWWESVQPHTMLSLPVVAVREERVVVSDRLPATA
jgi:hypothetical protein